MTIRTTHHRATPRPGWRPQAQPEELAAGMTTQGQFAELAIEQPVSNVPSRAQRGQVWQLGRHRLMCGDSTLEKHAAVLLDGAAPHCILTDPPYCSGMLQESGRASRSTGTGWMVKKAVTNDMLSTRGYMALLKQSLSTLTSPYILYLFTDWRMWVWAYDVAESTGYAVRSMIVWDKGSVGVGTGWRSQHELILCGARKKGLWNGYMKYGHANVITLPRVRHVHHDTEKPVALIDVLLETSPFAESIYDPFVGSGTTIIAAERQGRACYAMEIEPRYVDMAIARWEQYTGGKALEV